MQPHEPPRLLSSSAVIFLPFSRLFEPGVLDFPTALGHAPKRRTWSCAQGRTQAYAPEFFPFRGARLPILAPCLWVSPGNGPE